MIKEWIEEYNPQNEEEIVSALREIMQEITLASLSRTDFFEKAAFYGGTAHPALARKTIGCRSFLTSDLYVFCL